MTRTPEKRTSWAGRVTAMLLAGVLLVAMYFASLGPVAWALPYLPSSEQASDFWNMYSYPGQMLMDAGFGGWLESYVRWWEA